MRGGGIVACTMFDAHLEYSSILPGILILLQVSRPASTMMTRQSRPCWTAARKERKKERG